MSLDYLSKYLNKDDTKPKKRKRGTHIIEDDLTGWNDNASNLVDQDSPTVVEKDVNIKRGSGFKPIHDAENDEVSRDSVAVNRAGTVLSNGARAGLQTKEQVAADTKARRDAQMRDADMSRDAIQGKQHETVYRDATGRRIDITLAKQEKARELKRQDERAKKERELNRGLVQQEETRRRQAELESVRKEGFSRYAGHDVAERELKSQQRWNDPAAGFLTKQSEGPLQQNRPVYKGGFAPNRFGIRPGHRWDGVDRGNGYEGMRFKEIANQQQRRNEYEDWAKEDM